jgi:hypothetical protein
MFDTNLTALAVDFFMHVRGGDLLSAGPWVVIPDTTLELLKD